METSLLRILIPLLKVYISGLVVVLNGFSLKWLCFGFISSLWSYLWLSHVSAELVLIVLTSLNHHTWNSSQHVLFNPFAQTSLKENKNTQMKFYNSKVIIIMMLTNRRLMSFTTKYVISILRNQRGLWLMVLSWKLCWIRKLLISYMALKNKVNKLLIKMKLWETFHQLNGLKSTFMEI